MADVFVVVVFGDEDIEPDVIGPFESNRKASDFVERLERATTWANQGVSVEWLKMSDPSAYHLD